MPLRTISFYTCVLSLLALTGTNRAI